MRKKFYYLTLIIILLFFSCSGDNSELAFQNNDIEPEYRFFNLLEDYPALDSSFNNLDSHEFNQKLSKPVNKNIYEAKSVLALTSSLLNNPEFSVQKTVLSFNNIIERIIKQDDLNSTVFTESINNSTDGSHSISEKYAKDFYNLLDLYSQNDVYFTDELTTIINKLISYIKDTYQKGELEDIVSDLSAFLLEEDGTTVASTITLFGEIIGKLALSSDTSLYLDANGDVSLDKDSAVLDTGLGNGSRGVKTLLSGINDLLQDKEAKETFFELLSEIGKIFSSEVEGKDAKTVLKELIINLESHFTQGGEIYESNLDYHTNDENIHTDSELGSTITEIAPMLLQLLKRADRSGSMIEDKEDKKTYPLEVFSKRLYDTGFNPDNKNSVASRIEESLYETLRSDIMGKDRKTLKTGDLSKDPFNDPFLEAFVTIASTTSYAGWDDGGETGEILTTPGLLSDPSAMHGHGNATGFLTLNDVFFSIGLKDIIDVPIAGHSLNLGLYSLALPCTGNNISRRALPFTYKDSNLFKFAYDQNYFAPNLMSGFQLFDFGTSNGGNLAGGEGETMNSYKPLNVDGFGETVFSHWYLESMERSTARGEGPYYFVNGMKKEGNRYIYYRLDSRINLIITKPDPNDVSTWTYEYPYDGGNDIKDPDNPLYRLNNRYKATWNSDYYLIHYGNNRRYSPLDMKSGKADAQCVTYSEIIPENSIQRECKTYEEAAYRNFQWYSNEKKFAIIVPLYLKFENLLKGAAFLTIEANGIVGLMNAKKFKENGFWARAGHDNISAVPGDYRFVLQLKAHLLGLDQILPGVSVTDILNDIVYDTILGTGSVLPGFLGHTLPPAPRIGFPFRDYMKDTSAFVGSSSAVDLSKGDMTFTADNDDPVWARRNILLPVVGSLCGANWMYSGPKGMKDTLNYIADGLLPFLIKPHYYYQKDSGLFPRNTWKFNNIGGDVKNTDYGEYAGYFLTRTSDIAGNDPNCEWGGWAERFFFQPKKEMSILTILSESEYGKCDGLLPLLTAYNLYEPQGIANQPNTRVISKLIKLLYLLGNDEKYGDNPKDSNWKENDYSTWGVRRKLLYGLEQISSSFKPQKGTMNTIYEQTYVNIKHPNWIYEKEDQNTSSIRPQDISLSEILDEFIGSDVTGKGLSHVVDIRPNDSDWDNFYKLTGSFAEIFSDGYNGSNRYNIVNNIIDITDKLFTGVTVTDNHIKGLVHSLGSVFTKYNTDSYLWEYPEEITDIVTENLPKILDNYKGHYTDLMIFAETLTEDDGFVEYFLQDLSSDYFAEEIVFQLNEFLDTRLVSDYESSLWRDLSILLKDASSIMDSKEPAWVENLFISHSVVKKSN